MKVLIISHNPLSTQSNMGKTFLSLFSQFHKDELCQLFIYPVIPNMDRCASYYRVTDKDALNAVIRMKKTGMEIPKDAITEDQALYEKPEDQAFYKSRKNKSALRRLLRDLLWRVAPWYNDQLKRWLDREKPQCIFVAPGVAKFIYDFTLRIARDMNIPVITYICDEYYFVRRPDAALDRLRLKLLQGKMESLMAATAHLVVISEELKTEYSRKFRVNTTTLMTGATAPVSEKVKAPAELKTICYFGNIRCNRYVSLGQIGRELDRINREQGKQYRLKIYTAEKDPRILQTFENIQSVELCGFVSGAAFDEALYEADLLLHTEAFDEASMDFTKHSISTKIADSLASGIPLFAYGPEQLSSMLHLSRHECAIMAHSEGELRDALEAALTDRALRQQVAQNGLEVARKLHDSQENGAILRAVVENVINTRKS